MKLSRFKQIMQESIRERKTVGKDPDDAIKCCCWYEGNNCGLFLCEGYDSCEECCGSDGQCPCAQSPTLDRR